MLTFGIQEVGKTCLYKNQRLPIFYFKALNGKWYEYWYHTRPSYPTYDMWFPCPDFAEIGLCETIKLSTEFEFLVLAGKTPEQSWREQHKVTHRYDLIRKWWKPWVLDVVFLSIIICYVIRVYLSGGCG
jgi:hypothetical protein